MNAPFTKASDGREAPIQLAVPQLSANATSAGVRTGLQGFIMAHIVVAYTVTVYIVMALYSCGLYSYGLYSHGIDSHVPYVHGLHWLLPSQIDFSNPHPARCYSQNQHNVCMRAFVCLHMLSCCGRVASMTHRVCLAATGGSDNRDLCCGVSY